MASLIAGKLEVRGTDKLLGLLNLPNAIEDIRRAVGKVTLTIEAASKPITPIDKGFLRNSTSSYTTGLTGYVVNTAPYAQFVHQGTAKWPLSKPPRNKNTVRQFLTVGAERSKAKTDAIFQEMLGDITSRITK